MGQLPFSVYDFFGYLASGAVAMAAICVSFVGDEPLQASPNVLLGALLVIMAYALGHILGNVSGDLIESRLVRERLGTPTDVLMSTRQGSHSGLLPGYYRELKPEIQQQISTRAGDRQGEALFFHCHAVMKADPVVQERLNTFLNLYGFCRNMVAALVLAALCLVVGTIIGSADTGSQVAPLWWAAAAAAGAVGMLYRYLKFYRLFAVELLTSYAESSRT